LLNFFKNKLEKILEKLEKLLRLTTTEFNNCIANLNKFIKFEENNIDKNK
jgi:hypothetical protein